MTIQTEDGIEGTGYTYTAGKGGHAIAAMIDADLRGKGFGMKITRVTSHVLQYDLPEELGYSQQFYARRTAHLVEVETDEGVTGWGECFGPGNIARANQGIVEGRDRADDPG